MKQQIKILISKDEKSEGVWVAFPIKQREFDRLTEDLELSPKEFDVPKVICNSSNLSRLLMEKKKDSDFLTKLNYLGALFSEFNEKQRTSFGFYSDFLFDTYSSLDHYINLAKNIKKGIAMFANYTVQVPPEFKLRIKKRKVKQDQ